MEPLHMRIKRALTEKTQTNEIKKILLIDKNKASFLSTALQQEGYHLIHCDSVQKAWDLIYPHRPHLIVLHLYNFNNGAGLSDLQECQALAEGVPIILAAPSRVNQSSAKPRSIERRSFLRLRRRPKASQKCSIIWRSRR